MNLRIILDGTSNLCQTRLTKSNWRERETGPWQLEKKESPCIIGLHPGQMRTNQHKGDSIYRLYPNYGKWATCFWAIDGISSDSVNIIWIPEYRNDGRNRQIRQRSLLLPGRPCTEWGREKMQMLWEANEHQWPPGYHNPASAYWQFTIMLALSAQSVALFQMRSG